MSTARPTTTRLAHLASTIAGAVFGAVVLAACVTPHNSLGTAAGPCFRAFDQARAAVRHGRFVGVRDVRSGTAGRIGGATSTTPATDRRRQLGSPLATHGVCLFAFQGPFTPGQVDKLRPDSPTAGRYAVVAVTLEHPHVIGARLSDTLPLRFRHR